MQDELWDLETVSIRLQKNYSNKRLKISERVESYYCSAWAPSTLIWGTSQDGNTDPAGSITMPSARYARDLLERGYVGDVNAVSLREADVAFAGRMSA